jgi:hypothetical protein
LVKAIRLLATAVRPKKTGLACFFREILRRIACKDTHTGRRLPACPSGVNASDERSLTDRQKNPRGLTEGALSAPDTCGSAQHFKNFTLLQRRNILQTLVLQDSFTLKTGSLHCGTSASPRCRVTLLPF